MPATVCPNQDIIDELNKELEIRYRDNETWSAVKYEDAIKSIKQYPQKIKSLGEAMKLDGIGKGIGTKISEILKHGRILNYGRKWYSNLVKYEEKYNFIFKILYLWLNLCEVMCDSIYVIQHV